MFTIKIQRSGEGQQIISAEDDVTILRDGDHEYLAHCLTLEKQHKEQVLTSFPEKKWEQPHAIICYDRECASSIAYLYAEDRAWIMNANGKTVASV